MGQLHDCLGLCLVVAHQFNTVSPLPLLRLEGRRFWLISFHPPVMLGFQQSVGPNPSRGTPTPPPLLAIALKVRLRTPEPILVQKSVLLGFIRALLIRVQTTRPEVNSLRVTIAPHLHILVVAPLLKIILGLRPRHHWQRIAALHQFHQVTQSHLLHRLSISLSLRIWNPII